ncbi:hypothetical protein [Mesorhizobium sp. L103C131B0]|uniref:hypothetical protein n=1 Tax=Mesorhizobium sp. L103C131B0 TaxID=1287089 RepID=UPI0003CFBF34|nr:hypothetical protein [Mesorhizobium sp. L103C131B0]ESZ56499.1 hypothetical protein X729_24075 [Mesorhizobium sp. L103C131B0]
MSLFAKNDSDGSGFEPLAGEQTLSALSMAVHRQQRSEPMSDQTVPSSQGGAMTIDQFCKWAAIGRTLAYREISAGRLRSVKVGKRRLVTFADAVCWLGALPSSRADL